MSRNTSNLTKLMNIKKEEKMFNNPINRNRSTNKLPEIEPYVYLGKYIQLLKQQKKLNHKDAVKRYEEKFEDVFLDLKQQNSTLEPYDLDFFDVYFHSFFRNDAYEYINTFDNPKKFYDKIIKFKLDNDDLSLVTHEYVLKFKSNDEEYKSNEPFKLSKCSGKLKTKKLYSKTKKSLNKSKKIYK